LASYGLVSTVTYLANEAPLACSSLSCQTLSDMVIRAVAFDFGHTLVDEQKDAPISLESRPVHLMPWVSEILPHLHIPVTAFCSAAQKLKVYPPTCSVPRNSDGLVCRCRDSRSSQECCS